MIEVLGALHWKSMVSQEKKLIFGTEDCLEVRTLSLAPAAQLSYYRKERVFMTIQK